MPKAISKEESSINTLVNLFGIDLLKMRKEVDELKNEVRLQTLASDAQERCIKVQADLIGNNKREENIWRERIRKALNQANFQTEMGHIIERDKNQPF